MRGVTLERYLNEGCPATSLSAAVAATVREVARAACRCWAIARDPYGADLWDVVTQTNQDGDAQVKLDVVFDQLFFDAAQRSPVAFYASEERAEPCPAASAAPLVLLVDPLDGSSNVDLNLSYGTIFSILPALADPAATPAEHVTQPGRAQLAAGFFVYGPQLTLMLSVGDGAHGFAYSESSGDFVLLQEAIRVPAQAREFAINASNYRHWDESVRAYFDDCIKGVHGPRARDFNMRWLASLVVEAYRIMKRGGVFLYPADARQGYGKGRLRLVYEANPVAFLVEQAGGSATNGTESILLLQPASLHQRVPLIFGSSREVAKLTGYHADPSSLSERAPLFGKRGLFRI